jgi:cytochrome c peroxidase
MNPDLRSGILIVSLATAVTTSAAAACPEHLLFLESSCVQWQSYVLPETLPPSKGNAFADNEAAATLGMKIFYDNRFSRSGTGVACSNCHDPDHAFAEKKPTSRGIGDVLRNAPDLFNSAWYVNSHFWDGKVDNLWSAPLFTFEQDTEMGSSRLHVVRTLAAIYRNRYEGVFGAMPNFSDTQRFPASGAPGMPEFDAMSEADRNLVNQTYANVGKALEAYLRKLAAGRSPFDDFMNGHPGSLSAQAQRGMTAFSRRGCNTCHRGPTFTDEEFHDLGYPPKPGQPADPARAGGITIASNWQFTSTGRYADIGRDAKTAKSTTAARGQEGFRTPSLRNVTLTYPYGHDGQFATLDQVINAHAPVLPGHAAPGPDEVRDIIAFLRALDGRRPQAPWNYWPGGN